MFGNYMKPKIKKYFRQKENIEEFQTDCMMIICNIYQIISFDH